MADRPSLLSRRMWTSIVTSCPRLTQCIQTQCCLLPSQRRYRSYFLSRQCHLYAAHYYSLRPTFRSENVLDIAPKTKAPRRVIIGNEKRGKVMSDLRDIDTNPSTQANPNVLPNNASFWSYRSFSDVSCPVSYFRPY